MATTLFISDLHLDPARPAITALFLRFLAGPARQAEALYILGDLFEAWVGDDDDQPEYGRVTEALRAVADRGVSIGVMHGNRDFLMGENFSARTGCRLLTDPTVIDLGGVPTLLLHGDTLCTDDTQYQSLRATVRDPRWQRAFLARPLEERRRLAADLRETSREHTARKDEAIMDVNARAVTRAFREHGVQRMIHGHTHRPGVHTLTVDGVRVERIVLGDWYEQGSVLWCTPQGVKLTTLDPDADL